MIRSRRILEQIDGVREACRIAATVLDRLSRQLGPGVTTYDLDQEGRKLMEASGAESACYNYRVGRLVFPAHTCISVNAEVVHGIGSLKTVLREGDIVTLDVCVRYNGWIGDNARTYAVGEVDAEKARLLAATKEALGLGIGQARAGRQVGDISSVIQQRVEQDGFSVVREFVGHGVGRTMHESPQIPNFGRAGTGPKLREGMTIAIEPMVNAGTAVIDMAPDGWTALTADRKPAAHFEHTVLVTGSEAEILTIPEK